MMRTAGSDTFQITGCELDRLVAPMTAKTFLNEYWGRKPVVVKGGPGNVSRLFQGPFNRLDFYRAIQEAHEETGRLDLQAIETDPVSALEGDMKIEPQQVDGRFDSGATISAENIKHPRLAGFAAALKSQLGHSGEVSVFATLSPCSKGFPPHVDRTDAFFIQCEGTKRYLISEAPAVSFPRGTIVFGEDGSPRAFHYETEEWEETSAADLQALREVVLEPGDILYSPAGTIHATSAVGGPTLNVNFLLYHTSFLDLFCGAVRSILERNPEWRRLPQLTQPLGKTGALPCEVKRCFAERLNELRNLIDKLEPDGPEFNREWHRLVAFPGEATAASALADTGERHVARPIGRGDRLRLSRRMPLTCVSYAGEDDTPEFYLYSGKSQLSVAGEWVPFLQMMMRVTSFVAEEAASWSKSGNYPWEEVQEYLQALVGIGVLERDEVIAESDSPSALVA